MKRTGSNLEASYAASKKPHIGYQKSYYLFVGEQLLVRVGNEPVEEEKEEREQSILLEAIKKATRYPVCSIDLPENFFQEIRAGNPDVLIESLKKSIAFYFNGLRGYDIAHYCILGQWFQAAKYVIDDKKLDRSDHYYMAIAAMVGNVKVFDYIEQKQTQFALIMKIAKRFGNAKFMHVLTGHYKREEQRKIDEAAAQNKRISIPATDTIYKLPPLEAVIPSLRTVCAHVIAAETLRHPTFLVPRLATLPSELFTLVCLQIAEDGERGCRALMQIQTINPSLVNLVPTLAWINAGESSEEITRAFTRELYLGDSDLPIPMIDVFGQYDSFIIAPFGDFEKNVTILKPQPRPEPGTPSVVNRDIFEEQFLAHTLGFFEDFDFSNIVVIGGSVIAPLLQIETEETKEKQIGPKQKRKPHQVVEREDMDKST